MTIQTSRVILGRHPTPTNNFLLDTDLAGGLRIRRNADGSGGLVLSVDAAGVVSLPSSPYAFSKRFLSTDQTVTNGALLTVAHGLGAKPRLVRCVLKCVAAELGHAAGDEVVVSSMLVHYGVGGAGISYDATNVYIVQNATQTVFNRSTLGAVGITVANWRWVVEAWL